VADPWGLLVGHLRVVRAETHMHLTGGARVSAPNFDWAAREKGKWTDPGFWPNTRFSFSFLFFFSTFFSFLFLDFKLKCKFGCEFHTQIKCTNKDTSRNKYFHYFIYILFYLLRGLFLFILCLYTHACIKQKKIFPKHQIFQLLYLL
jgi:hypothetical protein